MMSFNKKMVAIVLLVGIFGQVGAMKRGFERVEGSETGPAKKKFKLTSSGLDNPAQAKFVIPSGWSLPTINTLPKNTQYSAISHQKDQPIDLKVSEEEQNRVKTFAATYYVVADSKLADAIGANDFQETSWQAQKLSELQASPYGIVAQIVASEFSYEEKLKLFDNIQKVTDKKAQARLFSQPSGSGFTPLGLAVMYDIYPLADELIHRGANPKGLDKNKQPIFLGIKSVEMGKRLLVAGASIDAVDQNGETLLHKNASNLPEEKAIATWAITEGLSVLKKNNAGQNAFQAQNKRGNANPALEKEKWAFAMTRQNVGFNPHDLFDRQAGQLVLSKY